MNMKELGKWEYDCLNRDLEAQGDEPIDMPFEEWYKNVFLIDEAWEEIRENHKREEYYD